MNESESINRFFAIIGCFTETHPRWTANELSETLDLKKSTVYRYLRSMQSYGILTNISGSYILGPRFIEIDRTVRLSDPVLKAADEILRDARDAVSGTIMISRFYGDKILSVYEDKTDETIRLEMDRGKSMNLLQGGPSRIVLSHLPSAELKNVYLLFENEIRQKKIAEDWAGFRKKLKKLRTDGYIVSSELDAHLVGISVPIKMQNGKIYGSLTFARYKDRDYATAIPELVLLAKEKAARIGERI